MRGRRNVEFRKPPSRATTRSYAHGRLLCTSGLRRVADRQEEWCGGRGRQAEAIQGESTVDGRTEGLSSEIRSKARRQTDGDVVEKNGNVEWQ